MARRLAAGEITAEALCRASLDRIAERQEIAAWTHVAPADALAHARELDHAPYRGGLAGIPVGVKDIMATVDMPTCYGSSIYAGHRPPWDAACVALTREAGGIILGKTVTTEFAFFRPGPTVNPRNPAHTPGGSSSGSAAAVADGHVPLAFGTQTAGSVVRPASYCGIVGFKASHRAHSLSGIKELSGNLDTLGWFARCVDDIALFRNGLLGEPDSIYQPPASPRIGLCRTPVWPLGEASTHAAVEAAAEQFTAAGASIVEVEMPPIFDDLHESQRRMMAYEVARALAFERTVHGAALSDTLNDFMAEGLTISQADYQAVRTHGRACRAAFRDVMEGVDVILTPAAPGEAPKGIGATGEPIFNRIWTLLGVPAITLPCHTGPNGLPVGIQLIAPYGQDAGLLATARWAEAALS